MKNSGDENEFVHFPHTRTVCMGIEKKIVRIYTTPSGSYSTSLKVFYKYLYRNSSFRNLSQF